jgi:replicative DNA helicase
VSDWWKDEDLQRHLLKLICRDRNFLKTFGNTLSAKDFKPQRDETDERWVIARLAFSFWKEYKEPIGILLRSRANEFADEANKSSKARARLIALVNDIVSTDKPVAIRALEKQVEKYLRRKVMADLVEEINEKKAAGELQLEDLARLTKRASQFSFKTKRQIYDFLSEADFNRRVKRRQQSDHVKRPFIFIEELDSKTKMPGRGDLGLIVGPTKKGKSLALSYITTSYAKQGLNVLYFTLEDPPEEVEDRFDANIAGMPIDKLAKLPKRLRKRYKKYVKHLRGKIKVVDATDGSLTIREIDEIWEQQRDAGFTADVIVIDYDKEIKPEAKHRERRFEYEEIYTDIRQLGSRRQCIMWTAAQSKRLPENKKILGPSDIGEDIGKAQKATITIMIGQGEHHRDARYLSVPLNKRGPAGFGVEVMMRPSHGLFYDVDATYEMKKAIRRARKIMRDKD